MGDESGGGGVWPFLAIVLIVLLIVGGATSYLFMQRQQAALAMAAARVRAMEGERYIRSLEMVRAKQELQSVRASAPRSAAVMAEDAGETREAVESVLREQQGAWNRGDVDAFVEHYWKSDELTFSSGGKTTRGWDETVRRYRERYPTREAMGELTFANLEIIALGDAAALALGEWRLERESEPVSGNFSLIFRKLDGRWVIVHDHTSRAEE